jgi:hypothetical protein
MENQSNQQQLGRDAQLKNPLIFRKASAASESEKPSIGFRAGCVRVCS